MSDEEKQARSEVNCHRLQKLGLVADEFAGMRYVLVGWDFECADGVGVHMNVSPKTAVAALQALLDAMQANDLEAAEAQWCERYAEKRIEAAS